MSYRPGDMIRSKQYQPWRKRLRIWLRNPFAIPPMFVVVECVVAEVR